MLNRYIIVMIWCGISIFCSAQQRDSTLYSLSAPDSTLAAVQAIPGKYYAKVDKKIGSVDKRLTKKTLKYLRKFQKQEEQLQKKLHELNPEVAVNKTESEYANFIQKLKSKERGVTKILRTAYNPFIDSLGTSLSFIKQFNGLENKAGAPLGGLSDLQNKLQLSGEVTTFIADRKNQIKELLSQYTHLPGVLKNEYQKLSKTTYYYSAQVQQYKDMLKDRQKIEKEALELLNKIPAFQKFMQKNSQLAQLFPMPGTSLSGSDPLASLSGLQTRSSIQALIQQRISSGGPSAQAQLQANLAAAQSELNKIKEKLNQFDGAGNSVEMPNFKPNTQKTKPFLERLEYIANLQFDKPAHYIPSSANIALGIGYKLNDKASIGVGLNYKMGMGTLQHISFSSQGIGFRSYVDWKIKHQIYASGGYEMNYNSAFKKIDELKNFNAWQRSGLIGLSKQYKLSKKVNGQMQLLYDFLANTHIPVCQPFLFRLGYKF